VPNPQTVHTPPAEVAAALLRALEHRHEVVHLIYTADDEADAARRIGDLLGLDEATTSAILDIP